jgi:hypothetical protein
MTDLVNNDPLKVILVDETTRQNRTREFLASILKGRVEIDSKTGTLELLPDVYDLSASDIILVLLCGKLAQKLLGESLDKKNSEINERMGQKEITEFLISIEPGTIKSSLHNLRDREHLVKNEDGKNFVAIPQLEKIKDRLSKEKKG